MNLNKNFNMEEKKQTRDYHEDDVPNFGFLKPCYDFYSKFYSLNETSETVENVTVGCLDRKC
jgi:hypothetical protein